MAQKLDDKVIDDNMSKLKAEHPEFSDADLAIARKAMTDHAAEVNARPDQEESLKRDAGIIADQMAKGAINFTSTLFGIPGDVAGWIGRKAGYDIENPFMGRNYINGGLRSGYEATVRLTGQESPKPVTQREKDLAQTFEKGTEYSLDAYALRGVGTALFNGGRWLLGKALGTTAKAAAPGEAAATAAAASKIDNVAAGKAADATASGTANAGTRNADDWNAFMGGTDGAAKGRASRAGATAEETGKTAEAAAETTAKKSLWERAKYRNNLLTYLSYEKKPGDLAQKLETLSQRLEDPMQRENAAYWIKLLVDKRRINGITGEELSAIKAQPHIPREVLHQFDEISKRNSWEGLLGKAHRGVESGKARMNFITEHPYITALETGSLYFKPLTYILKDLGNVRHHLKGVGYATTFIAGDYALDDNYLTGAWARSYVELGKYAIDGAVFAGNGLLAASDKALEWKDGISASSDVPSLEGEPARDPNSSRTGKILADSLEKIEKYYTNGTTNVVISTADQMGLQPNEQEIRNNTTWALDRFGPSKVFGVVPLVSAFNEAHQGDPNQPFMDRFARSWAAYKVNDYNQDVSGATALAQKSRDNPTVQETLAKAENSISSATQPVVVASNAPLLSIPTPQQLGDGISELRKQAEEKTMKLEEDLARQMEEMKISKAEFDRQMREQKEMLVAQKETLAKEYEDRKKELEEKARKTIETGKGYVEAGITSGLSAIFNPMGKWMEENLGIDAATGLKIGAFALGGLTLGSMMDNKMGGLVLGLMACLVWSAFGNDIKAGTSSLVSSLSHDDPANRPPQPGFTPTPAGPQ